MPFLVSLTTVLPDLKPSVFLVNVDDEVDGLPEAPMDVTEHIDES